MLYVRQKRLKTLGQDFAILTAALVLPNCGTLIGDYSSKSSPSSPVPRVLSFTPSSGAVGTLITITGDDFTNTTAITVGGKSGLVVKATSTSLVAMVMPDTPTGTVSTTTSSGTLAGTASFTVTATGLPGTLQGSKLVGTGNTGAARQGRSVAISADGNLLIAGGDQDNSGQGAFWTFTRSNGVWTQQGTKVVGTGNIGAAQQGWSAALSADGSTAIIGGKADNTNQGAAWVFTRSNGVWTQQQKLVGTGNTGAAQQGTSVAISADGNTAVVGGPMDNTNQGAVWVFARSGTTWTQVGSKLVGSGNSGAARQGEVVAISADGNTIAWGGPSDTGGTKGAAWIYTKSGSTWTQQGTKLFGAASDATARHRSVALSADGNRLAVGAPDDGGVYYGRSYFFRRSGSTWTQEGAGLFATTMYSGDENGMILASSADGTTVIDGVPGWASSGVGAAYTMKYSGGVWSNHAEVYGWTFGMVGLGNMGTSVAISAEGSTGVAGAPFDNTSQGSIWVFVP